MDIPIGPDNTIEPAQFNGMQPTHFPTVRYAAFGGRRERGAFTVTIPKGHKGDVVWTLRANGVTCSAAQMPRPAYLRRRQRRAGIARQADPHQCRRWP